MAAIRRDDAFWTSHKAACLAFARFAKTHPDIIGELNVPTARLAQMAGRDVDNDTYKAMVALMNLALAGHEEASREAMRLLESANTLTRVSWRQVLGIVTQEELESAVREYLPYSVHRVRTIEGGTVSGIGISPTFLRDWTLPEAVKADVARTFSDAVTDATVVLPDRQAAALMLGLKAKQFGEEDSRRVVDALMTVLTRPFEAHEAVRSIDNPLSMLRMNMGREEDVIAAAAESLLAFSGRIKDDEQRRRFLIEVSKLRARQVETINRAIACGLQDFAPYDPEEKRWLRTKLLLLLDSHQPSVRQNAAHSLADLVEREALDFDTELMAAVLFLVSEGAVEDRHAACHVLRRMTRSSHWDRPEVDDALTRLRNDPSYLVRSRADESL